MDDNDNEPSKVESYQDEVVAPVENHTVPNDVDEQPQPILEYEAQPSPQPEPEYEEQVLAGGWTDCTMVVAGCSLTTHPLTHSLTHAAPSPRGLGGGGAGGVLTLVALVAQCGGMQVAVVTNKHPLLAMFGALTPARGRRL